MIDYAVGNPNEKQKEFLYSKTKFTAYGGARGGGKSWVLRKKAVVLAIANAGIRILIVRRTYPEVMENHVRPLMTDMVEMIRAKMVKYNGSDNAMTFWNGSLIKLGYLQNDNDLMQYQGIEYDVIFMDEATQFTEYQFRTLTASMRGANAHPKRFYLTCNPGGVGHSWVKRLFIERRFQPNENPEDYHFIAASVYDNPILLEQDPGYVQMLEALPPDKRAAWLEGSWDVFEGQFFGEFGMAHIFEPRELPKGWRRYFAMDYGLDMLAGYWAAMDEKGECWIYREVFESNKLMSEAAQIIRAHSGGETIEGYFAPPDLWNRRQDTGRSVADAFAECGVYLIKVSNDRVTGWAELKEWMKVREDGTARLHISRDCRHLIESFPMLLHSKRDPNDVDTEPHEFTHGPDAVRYLICGRPQAAEEEKETDYEDGYTGNDVADFLAFGQ